MIRYTTDQKIKEGIVRYWMMVFVWAAAVAVGACSGKENEADAGPGEGDTDAGFQCYAVEPGAVSTQVDGMFTLIGLGFEDGMTVSGITRISPPCWSREGARFELE